LLTLSGIGLVKALEVEIRQQDGSSLLVRQTETVAHPLALPFYIGLTLNRTSSSGPTPGRTTAVTGAIDVAQVLRTTFGYALAEITPPPAEDHRKVAESLLALPADKASSFSAQQQDVLSEVTKEIAAEPMPSDADMALVGRFISDDRVTSIHVGLSIRKMLSRNPAKFVPLIPAILDRMAAPVDQRIGNYKSELGWSLENIPADSLLPYRDKIIAIVESQPDWPSNALLTRLAELGGSDAIDLVIRRLDARPSMNSPRQFAAIAACRANANTWPLLEPAVVSHVERGSGTRLGDEESALLLALVRFGKKAQAIEIVQKRTLTFQAQVLQGLNQFEPNFDPEHCRRRL
jgi:hypothetical protein